MHKTMYRPGGLLLVVLTRHMVPPAENGCLEGVILLVLAPFYVVTSKNRLTVLLLLLSWS